MRGERIYKRGNKYYFDITIDGKRYRKSTGANTIREAINIRDNYLYAIQKKEVNNIGNYTSIFNDVVIKFLENKKRSVRKGTYNNYVIFLKNIYKFFNGKNLNDIKKIDLYDYINFRRLKGIKDPYIREELGLLSSIFSFALENELINNNPFLTFKFKKELKDYTARDRTLSIEEIEKLLNNSNKDLRRLIIVLLETCMRIKEALNIQYTDIATDPNTNIQYLRIRKEISKSKRERFIPLTNNALEQILNNKMEKPNSIYIFTDRKGNVYKTTPKKALTTAIKKAGLEQFGFHILRHTGATLLLQGLTYTGERIKPKRIEVISELLGHSDINLTKKIYAKFDKQNFFVEFLEK